MRESHRYHGGNPKVKAVNIDNIVVIHNDDQPRALWKLGRVKELVIGQDGVARGAVLQVASKGSHSILRCPLQRSYPLEIMELAHKERIMEVVKNSYEEADSSECNSPQPEPFHRRERPVHAAARQANENQRVELKEL